MINPKDNPAADNDFPGFNFEHFVQTYSAMLAEELDSEMGRLPADADRRQTLIVWLSSILRLFVEGHDLGWLRLGPFDAPPAPGSPPDILFVSSKGQTTGPSGSLFDAAELVIEVVGPENENQDQEHKQTLAVYAAAGIDEFWRIDPDREQADFYVLAAGGDGYQAAQLDERGRFHSVVLPGFWLDVDRLWQTPLPRVSLVAGELGLL